MNSSDRSPKNVSEWIMARKAEGMWVTQCPSCRWWFAQVHKGRTGRRAIFCGKHRCWMWRKYRSVHGRAPSEWMRLRWKELFGDIPRKCERDRKRHPEPSMEAA